ncbi:MAG: ubiquinol-cytochrome c reductase iron-sulfur subunit [Gammaproteobacteria bacterium]
MTGVGGPQQKSLRRRLLLSAGLLLGALWTAALSAPFLAGLRPSRKTQAAGAPVEVDVKSLREGELKVVVWRLKPVWVMRRSDEMVQKMQSEESGLSDPQSAASTQPSYCQNATRSRKTDIFVAVGLCTHLGCSPRKDGDEGFFCACHGSRFDFAGRVFKGSPAPTNLVIPPYYYTADNAIVVGEDAGQKPA